MIKSKNVQWWNNTSKTFHGALSARTQLANATTRHLLITIQLHPMLTSPSGWPRTRTRISASISKFHGCWGGGTHRVYHRITRDIINIADAEQRQARKSWGFKFSSAKGILFICTISHTHRSTCTHTHTGARLTPSFYVQPELNNSSE